MGFCLALCKKSGIQVELLRRRNETNTVVIWFLPLFRFKYCLSFQLMHECDIECDIESYSSLECIVVNVMCTQGNIRVCVVYRPPSRTVNQFLEEFTDLIEFRILMHTFHRAW